MRVWHGPMTLNKQDKTGWAMGYKVLVRLDLFVIVSSQDGKWVHELPDSFAIST